MDIQPQTMQMQGQMHPQMMDPNMQLNMMDQAMNQNGYMGNDGFSAKPKVVKTKKYRDPYREYV